MRLVIFDCESFYDPPSGYTLSKMTTESYIRDPRFELHGAAIKWSPDTLAQWYTEPQLRWTLKQEDWSDTLLISHHAQFDHLILSHHYDVHPKMSGCTMSMARLMLGNHIGVSLDSVRKEFGIAPKVTPYNLFVGKHWNEMSSGVQQLVAEGACDEVESKWLIFQRLMADGFPAEELDVVDSTIKMFTEPCLRADSALLARVWADEEVKKKTRLTALGFDISTEEGRKHAESQLQSADLFAKLLREHGIEPAMKEGKPLADGTPKPIYAFAKTDPFMEELLADEDDEIRALAEARLGIKSTLLQTRAETLGWMASRGFLCVYLRYAGAHTSRWGGGDGSNFQNFTSGSDINAALCSPEGFLIAAPDASQIECRLLNMMAGQHDKIEDFRDGRDPYVGVATAFYGYAVNKKEHPDERQVGKVLELQCGFGSGGPKIQHTLRIKAKIILDAAGGMKARDAYRDTHPAVVQLWKDGEMTIKRMSNWLSFDWGPMRVQCDVERGRRRIILPNGIQLIYDTLEWHKGEEDSYWRLKTRKGWVKLYGAKLVENVIQALARVVVSQAMLRLKHKGYRTVSMKHDELWILVPRDGNEERHKQLLIDELSVTPAWMPGIPLAAEAVMGERYGK